MLISCNRLDVDALPRPAGPFPPPPDDLLLLPTDDLEASLWREDEGSLLEPRLPCEPRLLDIVNAVAHTLHTGRVSLH